MRWIQKTGAAARATLQVGATPAVVAVCPTPPGVGARAATLGLRSFDLDDGMDAGAACGASFSGLRRAFPKVCSST